MAVGTLGWMEAFKVIYTDILPFRYRSVRAANPVRRWRAGVRTRPRATRILLPEVEVEAASWPRMSCCLKHAIV